MSDVDVTQKIVRPSEEYQLEALITDTPVESRRDVAEPTPDLQTLKKGSEIEITKDMIGGYLVWCANTEETWFAPTRLCLNQNFIYREDLEILLVEDVETASAWAHERNDSLMPGLVTRKTCYILDNPGIEKYEVYFDPCYPAQQYGKCSPQGTTVRQYRNRFQRDIAILELDIKYSKASAKSASNMVQQELAEDQAIIVSDGAFIHNNSSCSFYYLDNESVVKSSECARPSDKDQGVIIAEINGAYRALSMCFNRRRTNITYYYDNTSIVASLSSKRMDSIPEVRRYRKLLERMDGLGYKIEFVEIHPKRGATRDAENKALMYFHNSCDSECRVMADLFHRNYRGHAAGNPKSGKNYKAIKKDKGARV